MFRKAAGPKVIYPAAYADSSMMSAADAEEKKKLYLFNCAQRAHGMRHKHDKRKIRAIY